jgi:hypothetical protein
LTAISTVVDRYRIEKEELERLIRSVLLCGPDGAAIVHIGDMSAYAPALTAEVVQLPDASQSGDRDFRLRLPPSNEEISKPILVVFGTIDLLALWESMGEDVAELIAERHQLVFVFIHQQYARFSISDNSYLLSALLGAVPPNKFRFELRTYVSSNRRTEAARRISGHVSSVRAWAETWFPRSRFARDLLSPGERAQTVLGRAVAIPLQRVARFVIQTCLSFVPVTDRRAELAQDQAEQPAPMTDVPGWASALVISAIPRGEAWRETAGGH